MLEKALKKAQKKRKRKRYYYSSGNDSAGSSTSDGSSASDSSCSRRKRQRRKSRVSRRPRHPGGSKGDDGGGKMPARRDHLPSEISADRSHITDDLTAVDYGPPPLSAGYPAGLPGMYPAGYPPQPTYAGQSYGQHEAGYGMAAPSQAPPHHSVMPSLGMVPPPPGGFSLTHENLPATAETSAEDAAASLLGLNPN